MGMSGVLGGYKTTEMAMQYKDGGKMDQKHSLLPKGNKATYSDYLHVFIYTDTIFLLYETSLNHRTFAMVLGGEQRYHCDSLYIFNEN